MKNDASLLEMLKKSEALLEGHFVLSSGLHTNKYVQCAKLTQYPEYSNYVSQSLARIYKNDNIDVVIGGAYGGIILAFDIARVMGKRTIFAERVDGVFNLRRGFGIFKGENVLIAEDVVTTGKSILEVLDLVNQWGGNPVGVASIIDRSNGKDFGIRTEFLQSVVASIFESDNCDLCKDGVELVKPGSRVSKKQ